MLLANGLVKRIHQQSITLDTCVHAGDLRVVHHDFQKPGFRESGRIGCVCITSNADLGSSRRLINVLNCRSGCNREVLFVVDGIGGRESRNLIHKDLRTEVAAGSRFCRT